MRPLILVPDPEPVVLAKVKPGTKIARSRLVSICVDSSNSSSRDCTESAISCKDSDFLVAVTVTSSTVCAKAVVFRTNTAKHR